VTAEQLPKPAEMAWASFPCQDLSLAGWRKGLAAERSGVFWAFWRILYELAERGERPPIVVIENVTGLLYGDSFTGLCEAVASLGMQFGALVIDARRFVPQSRPRVFLVAVDERVDCSPLAADQPAHAWTTAALSAAYRRLPKEMQPLWRWWRLPTPAQAAPSLAAIVEDAPDSVEWHTREETRRLLGMMTGSNREKVRAAVRAGERRIGFLYKRTRNGEQRAEVRFDGVSGCLRTPGGGSSRQTVVAVENGMVRTRLLSAREAARLMGAPDSFLLPERYNDAYQAMGDGVAAPVVSWLSEHLLRPLAGLCGKRETRVGAHGAEASYRRLADWAAGIAGGSGPAVRRRPSTGHFGR
jgi:DNA (cytosine-5)-methyltransferase 1